MKRLSLVFFFFLFLNFSYGQEKNNVINIKKSITGFLNWYRNFDKGEITEPTKPAAPIIVWKELDTMLKVNIDMVAVESYLDYLKSSGYLSATFINNLRQYHQKIADETNPLPPYPAKDGKFAIPGLNGDVIFGFEPEEILDHIKDGRFTKIRTVSNKAIVKFDISKYAQYLFTLSKIDGKWLIDSFGIDNVVLDANKH